MDIEVVIHELERQDYRSLDRLTEKELVDLRSGCFHVLGVSERLMLARRRQSMSGAGSYRQGGK